jgi:hypothetical protein
MLDKPVTLSQGHFWLTKTVCISTYVCDRLYFKPVTDLAVTTIKTILSIIMDDTYTLTESQLATLGGDFLAITAAGESGQQQDANERLSTRSAWDDVRPGLPTTVPRYAETLTNPPMAFEDNDSVSKAPPPQTGPHAGLCT